MGNLAGKIMLSNSFTGNIYAVVIRSTQATEAQIEQDDAYIRSIKTNVPWVPSQDAINYDGPAGVFEGDSITENRGAGYYLGTSWPYLATQALNMGLQTYNFGLSGQTLGAMIRNEDAARAITPLLAKFNSNTKFVFLFAGTNDLVNASGAAVYANIKKFCASLPHNICIVGTTLPRGTFTEDQERQRQALNSAIRSGWLNGTIGSNVGAVADFAADPIMGNASSLKNTKYYSADTIHPAFGGNQILARIGALAIEAATENSPR
jgi:hypothetical protein